MTLVDFIRNWIDKYKKGVVRKNTIRQHENNLNTHIKPYFKMLMLKNLKPDMYQDFLDHCLGKGLSRRTVEIINTTVYGAMERAVIQGKLERNPCMGSVIKGDKKKSSVEFIDSGTYLSFCTPRGVMVIYTGYFIRH